MQLIFQFWQPFFYQFTEVNASKHNLGYIFSAMIFAQYSTSFIVRKYIFLKNNRIFSLIAFGWLSSCLLLLIASSSNNFFLVLASFCLFLGIITATGNMLTAYLSKNIDDNLQSTTISILDLSGRFFGGCFLFFGKDLLSLSKISFGWPILAVIFFILSLWAFIQRKIACSIETV